MRKSLVKGHTLETVNGKIRRIVEFPFGNFDLINGIRTQWGSVEVVSPRDQYIPFPVVFGGLPFNVTVSTGQTSEISPSGFRLTTGWWVESVKWLATGL
jgi:hypothetical protein